MMKYSAIILMTLFCTLAAHAQNGSWWTPESPISGETVTIFFDPDLNGEMPDSPASLVLHWGVNQNPDWNPPPEEIWPPGTVLHTDGVAARSPMSYNGSVWFVEVPTIEDIFRIEYVVNDGTPSAPGNNWAHSTGGDNWVIELFQEQITPLLIFPEVENNFGDPLRSPYFVSLDETLDILATAVTNNTEILSLTLALDGDEVASVDGDTLEFSFVAGDYGAGTKQFLLTATDTTGFENSSEFYIMVNGDPLLAQPPAGVRPGINYVNDNTVHLALFAPNKSFVYLLGDWNDWLVEEAFYMNRYDGAGDSTLWWITLDNLSAGEEYAFQYLVDGDIRIADPYTDKVLDPWNDSFIPEVTYPGLKDYPAGKTEQPVSVLQTAQSSYDWQNSAEWTPPAQHELIIYELLLRDFIARHDYETLIDTLDYLQNLGINAIELMPFNEFEGNSSWGYNPSFLFAADKYYGTKNALKQFIDECHGRGMAVIMDIVLNHSYGQSPFVRLYWDGINGRPAEDSPWFNTVSPNPVFAWGYDFNHESVHTQALVDRVNGYWLTEYQVDGFRFDFTKGFTNTPGDGGGYDAARIAILERMSDQIWTVEDDAYVILEHFAPNTEEKELAEYSNGMMIWGNMNYNYNEATMGYNEDNKSNFEWGYYGTRGWNAANLVTYMESHDEERLMFKNLQFGNGSGGYQITDLYTAIDRIKLAAGFFLTWPGPKMIWQFGELGYDISIDDPCRICEKPILWNYNDDAVRKNLYKVYAALLKLRRENEVFRSEETVVNLWLSDSQGRKRITLRHDAMDASIIGNFGVTSLALGASFSETGTWYEYFTGDSIVVSDINMSFDLQPGELRIYTSSYVEPADPNILVGIDEPSAAELPQSFELLQNYPNPFNPTTDFGFRISDFGFVSIRIYDIQGRAVRKLVNRQLAPGAYNATWDGRDDSGAEVASGVYMYRMTIRGLSQAANVFAQTRKMILLR